MHRIVSSFRQPRFHIMISFLLLPLLRQVAPVCCQAAGAWLDKLEAVLAAFVRTR